MRVQLLPAFGDMPLRKITPDVLDRYYDTKRRAGIAANIRWQHDVISNVLRYTVRTLGWLEENPAARANPPRRTATTITLPKPAQLVKLLAQADDDSPEFGAFLRLAIATGARRGELCCLQWRHLDFDARELVIEQNVTLGAEGYVRRTTVPGGWRFRR